MFHALMPAGWLPNYSNNTLDTLENRNAIRYNGRIVQRIFQLRIGRKIRIFSLGWKNNILVKNKEGLCTEK